MDRWMNEPVSSRRFCGTNVGARTIGRVPKYPVLKPTIDTSTMDTQKGDGMMGYVGEGTTQRRRRGTRMNLLNDIIMSVLGFSRYGNKANIYMREKNTWT